MKYKNILEAVDEAIKIRIARGVAGYCPICEFYNDLTNHSYSCQSCIASWDHRAGGCNSAVQQIYKTDLDDNPVCIEALQDLRETIIKNGIEA